MVEAARAGPRCTADGRGGHGFRPQFDAAFSNATLHWMLDKERRGGGDLQRSSLAAASPARWAARAISPGSARRSTTELVIRGYPPPRNRRTGIRAGEVPFFLGCGAYRHHIPGQRRHLIQRGEFLTAYTPYQPEIAQGTLQVLFEFQTQVARLFGCDVANASMYDGSTACWEAIGMARRITGATRRCALGGLHPHYVEVAGRWRASPATIAGYARRELGARDRRSRRADRRDRRARPAASWCSIPTSSGGSPTSRRSAEAATRPGALLIAVVTEPVALGADQGAGRDGRGHRRGRGPVARRRAAVRRALCRPVRLREKHVRQMPGRLCGETVDAEGKRGFVLTLSTREQHIRREKATSNICTNSGLCALAFRST
jgi:glycine dehydrogenase subunit 1